jgi:hypothetical protein
MRSTERTRETGVTASRLILAVPPLNRLQLVIRAVGRDASLFGDDVPADALEDVPPDPVAFFAACADAGMFQTGRNQIDGSFRILDATRGESREEFTWRAETSHFEARACSVLANMLMARDLAEVSMRSVGDVDRIRSIAPSELPPRIMSPFPVDHVTPPRTTKDRLVRITLARTPDDAALNRIYALSDQWIQLLLLGAYPLPGEPPSSSGVIPELAALIDWTVVELPLTDAFFCNEQAFDPLIAGLTRLHAGGIVVSDVTIR